MFQFHELLYCAADRYVRLLPVTGFGLSVTEIMPGVMASRFSPLPVCRCMLPQRSTRSIPLASSRSRLVIGEVQSAVTKRCVGKRRSVEPSGETVAVVPNGQPQ